MKPLARLSVIDQTCAHLRACLGEGRWGTALPGVLKLAGEMDVSKDTIRAALRRLEEEGLLQPAGHGRRRSIAGRRAEATARINLRVAILLQLPLDKENGNSQRMLLHLRNALEASGHDCLFAPKSQHCLNQNPRRIARMVEATKADAWVLASASGEVLEWFSKMPVPAIGLGGRRSDAPVARVAMDLTHAFEEAVHCLKNLGHRRIVLICPPEWRKPSPGHLAQLFLDTVASPHGPVSADYHLPDWEATAAGFHHLLESLFKFTPPTALIVLEPSQVVATLSFLAQRGLRVPRDLSLITRVRDASLEWCRPALAHFHDDEDFLVRHIVRWIGAVGRGKVDRTRTVCSVKFEPGESIGPPPR